MTISVSVVVPTYRRPEPLDRCLSALLAQNFDALRFEIIIADDAASQDTRRQVEKWAKLARPAVRYVRVVENHGPAAARNAGWRAAQGRIIAFTDDDCIPNNCIPTNCIPTDCIPTNCIPTNCIPTNCIPTG